MTTKEVKPSTTKNVGGGKKRGRSTTSDSSAKEWGSFVGANFGFPDPQLQKSVTFVGTYQIDAIDEMFMEIPALTPGMQAEKGWAFCHPPEITWPELGTRLSGPMKEELNRMIMPFRWTCNVYRVKYGIMPWWVEEDDEGNREPRVPRMCDGKIRQYFDTEKRRWVYEWIWKYSPNQQPDPDMQFHVWSEPDDKGNLTSPAAAMIRTYNMVKVMRVSGERAAFQGSRMPYFAVHAPPKFKPGDERFQIQFGDVEEVQQERDAFNRRLEKGIMSRNALESAVMESRMKNTGTMGDMSRYTMPVMNGESFADKEAREGDGVLDRLVYLDDYWNIANAAPPVLLVDPLEYEKYLQHIAASLVDFPLSMVMEQHAQHAGNFDAQITFARDRMKEVLTEIGLFLEEVIVALYEPELYEMYKSISVARARGSGNTLIRQELEEVYRKVHSVKVEQNCAPLVSFEHLKDLWEHGVIDQETLGKHGVHIYGMDISDVKITKLKRPLELEAEQVKMQKEQADATNELNEKKLKLDANNAKESNAVAREKMKIDSETKITTSKMSKASKPSGGSSSKKK